LAAGGGPKPDIFGSLFKAGVERVGVCVRDLNKMKIQICFVLFSRFAFY
jgi:hypothetical protein